MSSKVFISQILVISVICHIQVSLTDKKGKTSFAFKVLLKIHADVIKQLLKTISDTSCLKFHSLWKRFLTLFRMGEGVAKRSPTSFFPVTSTNVGVSSQNFLTFSFSPFVTLV